MGTYCATLVADLYPFCYERDFILSLSVDKQADIFDAFNTTSRYLTDILNIDSIEFDKMVITNSSQSFNLMKQIPLILK